MSRFFLGIDTGATKSHALIADEMGRALGLGEGGPGNHESIGYDRVSEVLRTIIDQALASAGITKEHIAGAGFGIAGYDWPVDREPTRKMIESLGIRAPYAFVNDAMIALLAGASQGWGVAVIAGTGCNCRGLDREGREGRVTGEGLGEWGGGGDLVMEAVHRVAAAWTKRGPETALASAFIEHVGATDIVDFLEGLCRGRYHVSSRTAPLVFDVAAKGDPVAIDVIRWAGQGLASLAIGVIRQLGFEALEFEVVLAGSLYKGGTLLTDTLTEAVHAVAPGARFVHLNVPPVIGGVVLGMRQAAFDPTHIHETLIESTHRLLMKHRTEV